MNRHPEAIRGEEILASGETVRYDELRVGDTILGVGKVSHVHIGEVAHIEAGGHRFSKRAELKVTIEPRPLDFDARYAVDGYPGIAFYLLGYDVGEVDDDGFVDTDYEHVRATMVGDDYVHIVAVDDLAPLQDDDYCSQCGQIGCGHDGR